MNIKHVTWRQGRPRFNPGPSLKSMGYKSKVLRHEDGRWYSAGEALDWSNALGREIAEKRAARPAKRRRRAVLYTTGNCLEDWFTNNVQFRHTGTFQRSLAPRTVKDYRQKARVLEQAAPLVWQSDIAALDKIILRNMFNEIWQSRGLATANGVIRTLSAALTWALENRPCGITRNPLRGMRFQSPDARPRFGTKAEIRQLIAAADIIGLPEIGDCIVLGLWTAQRQGDRLAFEHKGIVRGRWHFRQSKTGAIIAVPPSPDLDQRMKAARQRREKGGIISPLVIMDEQTWKPLCMDDGNRYRKLYAKVRQAAIEGVDDRLAPMPSLKGFTDKALRSTAITWMAFAGVEIHQICAVSGHTFQSANNILKHYMAIHPDMADTAIARMVTWYETEGDVQEW